MMRIAPPCFVPCTLAAALSALPAQSAQSTEDSKRLTLDKMLDWESVRSPRLSPDCTQIVFTRSWTDKINDRRRSELRTQSADRCSANG